jgi:uncharacterized membrane protein (DUF485 family)
MTVVENMRKTPKPFNLKSVMSRKWFGMRLETFFWSTCFVLVATLAYGWIGAPIATAVMLGIVYVPLFVLKKWYIRALGAGAVGTLILLVLGAVQAVLLLVPFYLFLAVLHLVAMAQRRRSK